MNSRPVLVGIALLIPATAFAQAEDGSCRADAANPNPIAAIEVPTTIAMPHARVSLCDAPPVFTFTPDLIAAVGTFSIPLASLPTAPMTPAQFGASIAKVEIPAPWSKGDVTWTVKDGALRISAPVEPSAWAQVAGVVDVTLMSGQLVQIDVASEALVGDDTANIRANLQTSAVADLQMIQFDRDTIARVTSEIANPSTIPYGGQDGLIAMQQQLATAEAQIASMRPALAASWASATPTNRALAYWFLSHRSPDIAPLITPMDAAVTAIVQAPTDADRAKAIADFQALDAKASAIVDAQGTRDALLGFLQVVLGRRTADSDFGALLQSRDGAKKQIAFFTQDAAASRGQKLAELKASLPALQASLAKDQARLADAQKQLADPTPHRFTRATTYDSGCKPTETAKR